VTAPVDDDGPRRVPRTIGGVVYLLVVTMTLVGLGITVAGAWRTGVGWMGAALLLGALARAVLSERGAGMLRVRRRWSDVLTLTIVGVALIVLAVVVPEQPL
jgi:membrane protein required for beta-lactamase induction